VPSHANTMHRITLLFCIVNFAAIQIYYVSGLLYTTSLRKATPIATSSSATINDNNVGALSSTRGRRVPFIIQNIGRGETHEIDEIVNLCINVFFNDEEKNDERNNEGNGTRKKQSITPWKAMQLAYLRRFQTGDILARNTFRQDQKVDLIIARKVHPVVNGAIINGNREELILDVRQIFNADELLMTTDGGGTYAAGDIIGYCEVSEKNFGLGENFDAGRLQDKTKKSRPYLSNLSVVPNARQSGVGGALLNACEDAVRNWNANHTEIVLQVEEDNQTAIHFYRRRGWEIVFADPTCRRYDTSGFFLKESRITKYAMIKRLDQRRSTETLSYIGPSFIQKLRSSFFVK
jgi:ribosomal protein S18 acetylase RimI-like enzyme